MKANGAQRHNDDFTAIPEPGELSDAQLLRELLFPGGDAHDCVARAERLLRRSGGLRGLMVAARQGCGGRPGLDERCARLVRVAHELVGRSLQQSLTRGTALTSPALVFTTLVEIGA